MLFCLLENIYKKSLDFEISNNFCMIKEFLCIRCKILSSEFWNSLKLIACVKHEYYLYRTYAYYIISYYT